MEKLLSYLKSRTVWTFLALFLINGLNGLSPIITPEQQQILNTILTILGIIFRVNPKQFTKRN